MKRVRPWAWFLSLTVLLAVGIACARWSPPRPGVAEAAPAPYASPAMAELARQYEAAHPDAAKGLQPGETVRRIYSNGFEIGLQQMQCSDGDDGGTPTGNLMGDAQAAGRAFRDKHPGELDAVMATRGYRRVSVVGTWERGFEISRFVPADGSGETWTFGRIGKFPCKVTILGDPSWNGLPARVRFDGYVSGRGKFGHLGGYDREFLVLTVTSDDAAAGATPSRILP